MEPKSGTSRRTLLCLPKPKAGSHKGQNGVILIIGGNKTYHGAPILAAMAACRFCDLVYFSSTEENMEVSSKMKFSNPNVICAPGEKFAHAFSHADCVLIGNGMDADAKTGELVSEVLRSGKKCVIDAAAIRVLPKGLLHAKAIVTPHAVEFKAAFGKKADDKSVAQASKKYGCTILLKGKEDVIASNGKVVKVKGGNAGMTKGGTGDVLAGLCAAIFSTCGSPLRAAYTASELNKKAGELLYRCMGPNFSSEDLAGELAFAAALLHR